MRVFIVEDSAAIRERLCDMVSRIPKVELAGEADEEDEAVRRICEVSPDVVILDFSSANGNSLNLMYRLKLQSQAARLIVLTNNVFPQYRKKCMEYGAEYFMDKSRDIQKLEDLLSKMATSLAGINNCEISGLEDSSHQPE